MKLRVLFITRNYPPKVGGLEAYSYNLIKEFERAESTCKIILTKSRIHLVWFLPYCFFKGTYIARKHQIQIIHLCDALLAPVGFLLKIFTRAKISVAAHGLDITYGFFLYQLMIPRCVARLDSVICVSRATRNECITRGVPFRKCAVVPNGVRPEELFIPHPKDDLRRRLEKEAGKPLQNKTLLISVGRLVRRKGHEWFIIKVLPLLEPSYHYVIVGDGPEKRRLQSLVAQYRLADRVHLFGRVSNEKKKLILNASDIFIMPNITVPGDMEGFGIVAIEAGSCGLPVIASGIEGIRDAVIDGKTGYLIKEGDVEGFLTKIREMALSGENIRSTTVSTFRWEEVYKRYHSIFSALFSQKPDKARA